MSTAQAEVRRYALIIGANQGEPGEERLLYAVKDAERVAEVMLSLGDVRAEDLILLRDPEANDVARVMEGFNARIQADGAQDSVLFVFYSGHADPTAMHLGGSLMSFSKVHRLLRESPAQLRVMVVDACRSGELTRVKGARRVEAFEIGAQDKLDGEGLAIITSSAANEDALESERLGGSFFTHFFVTGLLGAADLSGDRRVTLTEVYQYAYAETLRATSRVASTQHPTYAFKVKGRQDLVLTRLDRDKKLGQVAVSQPGQYIFFQGGGEGSLVAEVTVEKEAHLALPAGRYLVRRRADRDIFEAPLRIEAGAIQALDAATMRRVPHGEVVRKGLSPRHSSAWAVITGAEASAELLPDSGPLWMGTVGVQMDLDALTLRLRGRYGLSSSQNVDVQMEQRLLGGEVLALKLFDVHPVALGFGVRAGLDWVHQGFTSQGQTPSRDALTARAGAVLHSSVALTPWMSLWLEGGADAFFLREYQALEDQTRRRAPLVASGALGLTLYLY